MKNRVLLGMAILMALTLLLATGCAKKQTSATEGQGMSFTTPAPDSSSSASQAEAEKAAMAKAEDALTANKIFFDFDKYDLKADAKDVLKAKAAILKKYGTWKLLIEGHCDERGTEEYNLALGERRARAAYEFLVVLGVPSSRLKIVSFGEERPVDQGHNEAAWAKNRRDEFKVFK